MPRDSARRRRAFMVAGAVAGVLAGVGVFLAALLVARNNPDVKVKLGDEVFDLNNARARARTIERTGVPLLFQDLTNKTRDLYVQRVSGRWAAFEAHAPGQPRRCTLQWERKARRFRDPCTRKTYRADGKGLRTYATRVDDKGHLLVDLRRPTSP